jgi:hypothetical protein
MKKIAVGVDPDSSANGVAVYTNGCLVTLDCLDTIKFYLKISSLCMMYEPKEIVIHVEDVCGVSAAFRAANKNSNASVKLKIAQHIGMCKQAQIEVEKVANHFSIKIVKHKISKSWKSQEGKAQFEKVTNWKGRSNEETRSAAFFGYLGI